MTGWRQDLRWALRGMRRQPGLTLTAVLVLALGVGGGTALFSVVDAVLLRPLPYPGSGRLVEIVATSPERGLDDARVSHQRFLDLAEQSRSFDGVAAYTADTVDLTGVAEPEQLDAARITAALLVVLRAEPLLGRGFLASEEVEGAAPAALLSHHLWQERFSADPAV
ncbi:MAG: ABC transporter permease, partial [Nitrospirota bacterium]